MHFCSEDSKLSKLSLPLVYIHIFEVTSLDGDYSPVWRLTLQIFGINLHYHACILRSYLCFIKEVLYRCQLWLLNSINFMCVTTQTQIDFKT